jgi:hypothetical protein
MSASEKIDLGRGEVWRALCFSINHSVCICHTTYNTYFHCVFIGYGISSDGRIIYINASTCDINYFPANPPVVFDVTLPPDIKKL